MPELILLACEQGTNWPDALLGTSAIIFTGFLVWMIP